MICKVYYLIRKDDLTIWKNRYDNVAELANAPDLKSVNPKGYVGSKPTVVVTLLLGEINAKDVNCYKSN